MDETTLLIIVSLVGPIVGGIVGAVAGYYLGKRSLKSEITEMRESTALASRHGSQAAIHKERVETAIALLKEVEGINRLLKDGYHQFITANTYWNPIPTIPTPAYSQLFSQGRIVKLGVQVSPLVDAAYGEIAKMNRAIEIVNRKVSENRRLAHSDPQRYLGDDWYPVTMAKDAFQRQAPGIEEALKRVESTPEP
jgi:hypothetical protein